MSRGPRTADRDPRIPGVAVVHIGNRNPRAVYRIVDRVFARPILNRILEGEWLRPGDLHEVDNARPSQIDEHPLRTIAEVRIAFPEGGGIAVVDARPSVVVRLIDRVAAAWEPIPV